MNHWRRALAVCLPLCAASCVPPPPQPAGGARVTVSNGGSIATVTGTLIALPGHTLKIGFFHDPQNADCSVQGGQHIVFTVLSQPQHGTLDVEQELDYPDYAGNTLMFKCDNGRISGTEVTYRAADGYSGTDEISYRIYFPNGHELVVNTTIDVQPQ
jgi:hypothetical protein